MRQFLLNLFVGVSHDEDLLQGQVRLQRLLESGRVQRSEAVVEHDWRTVDVDYGHLVVGLQI